MRFAITIPDPATLRAGKAAFTSIPAGTTLHRIHPARFGAAQFNDTDKGNARFSPIRDKTGSLIPTIYAAQSFECACCEIVLRCPDVPAFDPKAAFPPLQIVFPSDFSHYRHSTVETTSDLKLLDLTVAGQRKLGVDRNALLAGPASTYPVTRHWAEEIHARCPEAQGIYYSSVQFGPHFAIVLFGDRVRDDALQVLAARDLYERGCHDDIRSVAQSLSIDYQDI